MKDEIIDGISAQKNKALIRDVQDRLSGFAYDLLGFLGMPVNRKFRLNLTNIKMLEKESYFDRTETQSSSMLALQRSDGGNAL